MKEIYRVQTAPKALEDNQIRGAHYRITVLTERLLRLEYDRDEVFEDRSTQVVFDRDFPKAAYEAKRTKEGLELSLIHI